MWNASAGDADQMVVTIVAAVALIAAAWWVISVVAWVWTLRGNGQSQQLRWAMPGAQRLARALLAPSLLVSGVATACTSSPATDVPTLVWVDESPNPSTTAPSTTAPSTTTPSTTTAPSTTDLPSTTQPTDVVEPPPHEALDSSQPGLTEPPAPSHVVAEGEHLWSIAANHLVRRNGFEPTNQQVASYWRQLIDRNRANLFSGQPDLIHPGEILILP